MRRILGTIARLVVLPISVCSLQAFGQNLAVQQPIVESFGVGTTVSVPVGGSVSLGGVGRATAATGRTGFLPRQGGVARSASAASMSASVYVHDFELMDRAVLDAADGAGPRPAYTKSRYSDATSYAMSRRYAAIEKYEGGTTTRQQPSMSRPSELTPVARPAAFGDTERMLALGEAAERRGQPGVAAIHYRLAAKAGSAEAEQRLAGLASAKKVATVTDPPLPNP